ncbi:hydrolase, alpha/beta domain protein [Necator americanus]|uniref:Lipase n=1 Tax=Necator americanus TaxID=51031 RepID=W2T1D6_NECAM|nr:hydrolase, alpha/beta domain protein [Necator americanus]ETN75374.1 hydrolase, alpha/beta domain protein [Necator americanus]
MIFIVLLVLLTPSTFAIDPECYMTVPEIIRHFGYPSEVHLVRTADEYILELHRIPHGQNQTRSNDRPVVFLQHGIFADGFNWTPNLPNQSAGFVFADAGFDVWIANSRGTPPSQKHIGYGPEDVRFWNFTWQHISAFDLPSSIDYVLQKTGQNDLYYIGHSQGTVVMFAKLAEDAAFATKIRQFHALAPVATVSHIGGLFRIFGNYLTDVADVSFLPIAQGVCTLDIGFIDGKEKMFNNVGRRVDSRVGLYLCHTPAATSTKNLLHWVQVVKSRKFEKFDYGKEGNMIEYGEKTPPIYDLRKIETPTFLYWSKDDVLADTEDIRETILESMNATIHGSYELPHYTHLDFVFGINATFDLYRPIIEEIRKDYTTRLMLQNNRVHT